VPIMSVPITQSASFPRLGDCRLQGAVAPQCGQVSDPRPTGLPHSRQDRSAIVLTTHAATRRRGARRHTRRGRRIP
jgi:hypothetical protein